MSNYEALRYVDDIPARHRVLRLTWEVVYILTFRWTPRWAMHGWRRTLLRLFGAEIGSGSRIAPSAKIWAPWNLKLGEYVAIGDDVYLYAMNKITIGSKVAISQESFICAGTHDATSLRRPLVTKPIVIEDHVWIAARAFVHPGVHIAEGTIVGACSVVNKSLPAWMICAGTPCVPLKSRVLRDS